MQDPYVYENSNVLINKADIKDKMKLDEFENRMTNLSLVLLFKRDFEIYNVFSILKIHNIIFNNVYAWAGNARTIDIYKNEPILNGKSVQYSDYQKIKSKLDKINQEYFNQDWKELSREDFIHIFTRLIANIWQVHPFREGNTRTVSAFAFLFLKQLGYTYNIELINEKAKYFRNALVMASIEEYSEYQYLQNIISDAIFVKRTVEPMSKYEKIKDYKVESYAYEYHKVKQKSDN